MTNLRFFILLLGTWLATVGATRAEEAPFIIKPDAFQTLVNPQCSHCRDEAKRRAGELRADDRVLCWTRGYSDGGAIPIRFFLNPYRVISDSYGVFVYDPDAGYARGFKPDYNFRFHGWHNGVMLMQHKDGTVYSCLTGQGLSGPKKGTRLTPIPTLVSNWGNWLEKYPQNVAYHMFDKYQPTALPTTENPDAVKSRPMPDPRLKGDELVLGVWSGKQACAYPLSALVLNGMIRDELDGTPLLVFWDAGTGTASAYRPVASQPRKFKGPNPDANGHSPPDAGELVPPGARLEAPRRLSLHHRSTHLGNLYIDDETQSTWDIAGRCVAGALKGWTLEWVDSVQVKWLAWSAEYPQTLVYQGAKTTKQSASSEKKMREVAGSAEFLRLLPKPFGTVKAVDARRGTVTLLLDGDKVAKLWQVEPDAEIKINGWWGRLEQVQPGSRVWVWLKLDRQKDPVSVVMLADEVSEFDFHAGLRQKRATPPRYTPEQIEAKRRAQQAWLRDRWLAEGLPGTLTFHHVFSGELELTLDHEAISWGRSLNTGDTVQLAVEPPIKGVVKRVMPWRERTVVRLVVGELESSELRIGQRLALKMALPKEPVELNAYPPDLDRPRSTPERIEWFLASIYCACGVKGDICTGHFYTLASCNPNGCAMPHHMRTVLAEMIGKGLTDRQILEELLKEQGPLLLKPHLMP
jgi:hypothetical protein